jgi:uncharacterized protein YcfL
MHRFVCMAALAGPLVVMGCASDEQSQIYETQDQVCLNSVADRIGQSADTLSAVRTGTNPAGEAVWEVRSPGVTYTCTIDDRLNVIDIISGSE